MSNLLAENRTKTVQQQTQHYRAKPTPATGPNHPSLGNPYTTQPRADGQTPPSERKRHDCEEEQTQDAQTKMKKPSTLTDFSGPPPQHPAIPPRPAGRQHHLSGPPSQRTTARKTSHDAARYSHPQPEPPRANRSQTTVAAPTSGAAAPV
jgi:hypothetical protein